MSKVHVQTKINGEEVEFLCEPRQSLLEVLREELGFTGTKEGCNDGNCGACSTTLDGVLVDSCLVLAVEVQGKEITTVEGLATNGELTPLQIAFNEHHALQCGYCTPGILMNMDEFLKKNPDPTEDEIRHGLIGNLCRCTGYAHIVEAVKDAAKKSA